MAQKVRIILEDDLDGGPADETIRFGLDGAHYEIDLSSANAARLRDAIRPFVAKSRHKVSDRGRIHQDVQDAYYEAMKAQG